MKGVLLAGGEGKRLENPLYNKHLSLVYDRLMIEYPLRTLGKMGCTEVMVVGSPSSTKDIIRVFDDGKRFGMDISYKVQHFPLGAADALSKAEGFADGTFPVLCGDVYFDPAPEPTDKPTLYYHEFEGAQNHSVWNPETNEIIEKPTRDIGKRAIVGYVYDERVFEVIKTLQPTSRGELELIDLHNWYLQNGADVKQFDGFFGDMGTPDGLLRVANYIAEKK